MLITFGKYNLKNYFFLLIPIVKIIRELLRFSDSFYNVKNILVQYFFSVLQNLVILFFDLNLKKN